MTRVFPDFNELVAKLAKRGVTVKLFGRWNARDERMSYRADVSLEQFRTANAWPAFNFTVYGREVNELADDIVARLPLVEPIIAADERRREHAAAIKDAERIGRELAEICIPRLEPNDDPKTAKDQPLKVAA